MALSTAYTSTKANHSPLVQLTLIQNPTHSHVNMATIKQLLGKTYQ